MMDVYEAAAKWGCSVTPVKKACKAGRIPGVQLLKMPGRKHPLYQIPDNTPLPSCIHPRGRRYQKRVIERASIDTPVVLSMQDRSSAAYVWSNQNRKTIGELARELGVPSRRVTELFDIGLAIFFSKEAAS